MMKHFLCVINIFIFVLGATFLVQQYRNFVSITYNNKYSLVDDKQKDFTRPAYENNIFLSDCNFVNFKAINVYNLIHGETIALNNVPKDFLKIVPNNALNLYYGKILIIPNPMALTKPLLKELNL